MTLSAQSTSKMADAIKQDVIDHIYASDEYAQVMQDLISSAIHAKLGDLDETLFFDLGMVLFDRIELK